LSTRSDQRPGGAATAGTGIQRVRPRGRSSGMEEGRSTAGARAEERSGKATNVRLAADSQPLDTSNGHK
jgi:hypothetical protein